MPSERLRSILMAYPVNLYDMMEEDDVPMAEGISWRDLLNKVQLSEKQLREEVQTRYPVIERDGLLYLLSVDCQSRVLDEVVELCDNRGIPEVNVSRMSREDLAKHTSGTINDAVLEWILRSFCVRNEEDDSYSLSEMHVCRARAVHLLQAEKTKDWTVADFEMRLELHLPNSFIFKIDYLKGVAFIQENIVVGRTIRSLHPDDLPRDAQTRLDRLFALQQAWRKEDIEPYIIDFCAHPSRSEEFLLKNCRIMRKGTERLFSRKQNM